MCANTLGNKALSDSDSDSDSDAHAFTLLHHVSQMMLYSLDHELFQAFSIIFLPVILVQVDLNFSHPKNTLPEEVWIFLDVFWQSLIWPCLHLVVNPLYLLS